ncbi:hypothetical protein V8E54_011435 [Elaphomyces granulatus]
MEEGRLLAKIKAEQLHCCPGNVDSEDYISNCFPPMPLQGVFTGTVGKTHDPSPATSTECRSMEINTCVWDADVKSVSFSVLALFPTIPRWETTRLPRRGSLVTVMGDIVGTSSNDRSQAVVVIRSFSYIFVARGLEKSNNKPMDEKPASRWKGWQRTRPPAKVEDAEDRPRSSKRRLAAVE